MRYRPWGVQEEETGEREGRREGGREGEKRCERGKESLLHRRVDSCRAWRVRRKGGREGGLHT